MGTALLIFAVVGACIAAGVSVYCVVQEASEAWDIAHHGWAAGHHVPHGSTTGVDRAPGQRPGLRRTMSALRTKAKLTHAR